MAPPPASSSSPSPPLSAAELEAAFSFLPHIHNLLHSLQLSVDPKQTQQAVS